MLSSDRSTGLRAVLKRMAVLGLLLPLGGCIQPLYNTLGAGGMEKELQAIKVEPIADRTGHYLAQELMFAFNGTGEEVPPRYRLIVAVKERIQSPVVDTVTYRATSATVIEDAEFRLVPVAGGEPLMKGVAFGVASYDRFSQRISNVRAARDAQVRDARALAEQIRTQIAAKFAAGS